MKVWIETANTPYNLISGKALFMRRLADELRQRKVNVVSSGKTDVSLNVISIKHWHSTYKIVRFDGVWHDTARNWRQKNRGMRDAIKHADGVIYQSNFARRMCNKYLGEPKCPSRVIFNGSLPSVYDEVKPASFQHKHVFIAFSKWRPHKRLRDIIESFLIANGVIKCMLIVAGDGSRSGIPAGEASNYFAHRDIEYVGSLPQNLLMPILKAATASIHLCWFDACPNSVVEALCAGVPVICNNVGGTWEIVGPSGAGEVLAIDEPYDCEPVDLYHPPAIDRHMVADAMIRLASAKERPVVRNDHVNIANVATEYLRFMEGVCTNSYLS